MSFFLSKEEMEIDRYIEAIDKRDIPVPEILEKRITDRISETKAKRNNLLKVGVVCSVILAVLLGSILYIPGVNSYAKNVPVIRVLIEFIEGDLGTEAAKKKGYMGEVLISASEDGYKFTVDSIILDEERLIITGAVSELEADSKDLAFASAVEIVPIDFIRGASTRGGITLQLSNDSLTFKVEKWFKEGEVQRFVERKQNYVELAVMIYKRKEEVGGLEGRERRLVDDWLNKVGYEDYLDGYDTPIKEFKSIKVPIDVEKVLMSENYIVDKVIDDNMFTQYGLDKITISNFMVGPTSMKVQFNTSFIESGYLLGFVNGRIEDENGNNYRNRNNDTTGVDMSAENLDNDVRMMEFIPSIYFDIDKVKKLYFCFDGIKLVSSIEGNSTAKVVDVKGRVEIKD